MLFLFSLFLNLLPLCLLFGTFVRCASPRLFLMSHFLQKMFQVDWTFFRFTSLSQSHTHIERSSKYTMCDSLSLIRGGIDANTLSHFQHDSLSRSLGHKTHTFTGSHLFSLSLTHTLSLFLPLSLSNSLCQTTSLVLSLPATKHTILPALSQSLSVLFSLSLARPLSTSRRRRRRPCCCCCCRRRRCCCTIF